MIPQHDIDTATRLVAETRSGSFSMLQRRMHIGYLYAERLTLELFANGVLGPVNADGTRAVLIPPQPSPILRPPPSPPPEVTDEA